MTAVGETPIPFQAPSPVARFLDRRFGWLLVGPSILVLLLIGLFPIIYSLLVSFQKVNRRVTDTSFQGLYNYERLVSDDRFWESVLNTGIMTAIALPLELIFGLLLARLFLRSFPGRQILIAMIVTPAVIAPFIAGAMWRLMFDNIFGPINEIIRWIIGGSFDLLWLVNDNPIIVYSAILITEIWQWTPFMFLILLAAWSNVDKSQLEAAEIDGASGWRVFRKIVFPAIRPVVFVALTIRGLDLVRLFDIVFALTRGGPGNMTETISIYAYIKGFERFDISLTAAFAFLVIVTLSILVMIVLRRVGVTQ
ncbi:MAG: sugar ABC transporter permease [Hyphomicrobiales bacterium]|nr:sugar ABC transporter permease [Hyphomicrobiales bacterium]